MLHARMTRNEAQIPKINMSESHMWQKPVTIHVKAGLSAECRGLPDVFMAKGRDINTRNENDINFKMRDRQTE